MELFDDLIQMPSFDQTAEHGSCVVCWLLNGAFCTFKNFFGCVQALNGANGVVFNRIQLNVRRKFLSALLVAQRACPAPSWPRLCNYCTVAMKTLQIQ